MKLANFESRGRTRAGLVRDGHIFEVPTVTNVQQIIEEGKLQGVADSVRGGIGIERVKLNAPITSPDKILCAAVNYKAHGVEQKTLPPTEPYFFTKFRSCIIGNGDSILLPRVSKKADWEVELAVVIGRMCKYVRKENALDYVAGYTIANDVSFRDLQVPDGWPDRPNTLGQNWVKGKGLDAAFPLGPWLVTKDEIPDPQHLSLSLEVNGVVRQKANTEDMVFTVAELIEYLSDGLTLLPGDIISTGTPAGVALFSGAPFLKNEDTTKAEVQGIGTLTNPVKTESRT